MTDEALSTETEIGLTPGASAIKSAGAAYLATLTDETKAAPLSVPEDADETDVTDDEETEVETPARDETGKFAKKDEKVAESDDAEPDAKAETTEEDETDAVEEGTATVVVLKGIEGRGEEDLEIDVADEETAVRLRRLQNDGMRRADYDKAMAAHEEEITEYAETRAQAEANPVGFMVGMIEPGRRLEVARALLTECFEDLKPDIEKYYEDPTSIRERRIEIKEQTRDDASKASARIASNRAAAQIEVAVKDLVPDGVDPHLRKLFLDDAERDLIDAVKAGERISPAEVPRLLTRRLKMYGFAASASAATARPVSDAAKAIAAKKETAQKAQTRIKRTQVARKSAAAIPPGGRGAASVTKPLVAKGATIADASRAVKQSGALTWADLRTSA